MAFSKQKLHRCLYFSLVLCAVLIVATLYYESPTIRGRACQTLRAKGLLSTAVTPSIIETDKNDGLVVNFENSKDNPYKERKEWKIFLTALKKYKTFHNNKLKELKSGKGGKVRTLTWACSQALCSGLGDQLFRIQYFFLIAVMSNRVFTIRWDDKMQRTTKYLVPNEIDWSYFNSSQGMCDDNHEHPCSHPVHDVTSFWGFGWTKKEVTEFEKVLFDSEEQHITVTGEVVSSIMYIGNSTVKEQGELIMKGLEELGVRQILLQKTNETVYTDHKPLWYSMFHKLGIHHLIEIPENSNGRMQPTNAWLYVSHIIFTYLFGFTQKLVTKVKEYQQSLQLYNKDYLVVHLRTGFLGTKDKELLATRYIHEGWKLFSSPGHWRCIIQHSIKLRKITLGASAPIYISTDSDLVKDLVTKEFSNQNIKFSHLALVHSRLSHKACSSKTADPAGEAHMATWLDFFMLAEAKVIVHSESSFSVNAAFLKPIPHSAHSWVIYDNNKGCLASHIAGNSTCICE